MHGPGVQVDAGVEAVLGGRRNAWFMVSLGWVGPEPGSWLASTSFLKLPRLDTRLQPRDPFNHLGQAPAHPNEASLRFSIFQTTGSSP